MEIQTAKESDDITELGTRGSGMSIIRHDGIRLVYTSRKKCKNLYFYEKYAKAVPLERLLKDFRSMKAEISPATLAN